MATSNCIMCDKTMDLVEFNPEGFQPYDGGEMRLVFSYGSGKFDLSPGFTQYRAVICDDCAEKLVPKMKQELFSMDGAKRKEGGDSQ